MRINTLLKHASLDLQFPDEANCNKIGAKCYNFPVFLLQLTPMKMKAEDRRRHIAREKVSPFSRNAPNAQTRRAIAEARAGKMRAFEDFEMFAAHVRLM